MQKKTQKLLTEDLRASLTSALDTPGLNVAIICHVSPDGDAIGSSLALMHTLRRIRRDASVRVITPDMPPRTLQFLPGFREIVVATRDGDMARRSLADADVIFCLDFNALMRVDRLRDALGSAPGRKILIDHHLSPEPFADTIISHPEMSSTCYLLYLVLCEAGFGDMIDRNAAECICTGMMTDTGNFTYNAKDPGLYLVVAELMERGVDKDRIYKLVFDTNSEQRLRICGYALYRKMMIFPRHSASLITLTQNELMEFGYQKGDTESLVNQPLSMPGVTYSVFMRQDEKDFVKVSMRSKGHFPVNLICEDVFGGGGHENAAGGEFYGSLDEAVTTLLEAMERYDRYLPH